MESKAEEVLCALHGVLWGIGDAALERNTGLPEEVPPGGLMILRDGRVDDELETMGGFDSVYVRHTASIEVFVCDGDAARRDQKFDALVRAIGQALRANKTLGGLAYGLTVRRPEPETESLPGVAAIKAAAIPVTIEYEAPDPLG